MLRHFKKVSATLRTFGESVNVNGTWRAGGPTDTPIQIVEMQPAKGAELVWLPEGDRRREHFFTWAADGIAIHDSLSRKDADQIITSAGVFLVVKVENWADGNYLEILLRRLPGVTA